jgi:hypothetical protein
VKKKTEPVIHATKIKAVIEAEYAPLISLFTSTEETRYYLNGFLIETHPVKGVCLVATDGHILGAFHHEDGYTTEPLIVKLNKAMLQACNNTSKGHYGKRFLVIDGDDAKIIKAHDIEHAQQGGVEMIMSQGRALVEGKFPDWRRIIPHDYSRSTLTPAINGNLLKPFIQVAAATGHGHAALSIKSSMLAGPCLVTTCRRDFFGVVMPLRESTLENAVTPLWARQTEADKLQDTPMEVLMLPAPNEVYGPPMPEGYEGIVDILNPEEPDPANDDAAVEADAAAKLQAIMDDPAQAEADAKLAAMADEHAATNVGTKKARKKRPGVYSVAS